ncbi:hypothetical protein KKA39_00920 [Patescibacteria group bacterium]|nr:hypothetical protein [Patescibacteria group bacterium]MBU1727856.1 hypothetical protein [Patescibacteria group bacterium]
MKKIFVTAIVIILVILGMRFLSREDNWICQDGQWVKHGNPSSPIPETGCGDGADDRVVSYSDLDEKKNIENYLKDNINTLSPVKAVLGGTWYVLSSTVDLKNKSGVVTYEDGHIQEKKNFSYIVNEKREVTSLTIN